jgi:branched-chain amino acid transport system substrate-binding protein
MSRRSRLLAVGVALFGALLVAACGDDDDGNQLGEVEALSNAACEEAEYEGEGDPQALIVSDLPMQGDSAERSEQQVEAIRLVLENNQWKAGGIDVAFQVCDDSSEETGLWSEDQCRENAQSYAENPDVIGVIGTYNSGCAAIEIPILNQAGVAMVSPGNTSVCLTQASSSCVDGQPPSLYPAGRRNYVRVVPNDAFQGAALVEFAQRRGIERPFVLYAANDPTSTGQAENFQGAAAGAGLALAGYETWDPDAPGYANLFQKVADSEADAVVLAGLTEQNGGRLIENKVATVGSNQEVPLIAFDGFAQQATIDEAGEAAAGMFASVPGRAPQNLRGRGERLVAELRSEVSAQVELYAPYAGEAAKVLLDAIDAASAAGFEPGGERSLVARNLFQTTRTPTDILGAYRITPTGDPSVGPVTIFVADGRFQVETEVIPDRELVGAARGLG